MDFLLFDVEGDMKRRCLSVAIFIAFSLGTSASLAAQAGEPRLLDFSVKGGLSLPTFFWTGDNSWNDVTMFALQGEAYAYGSVNITPGFGVEVDAGYRGKGCSVDASDGYAHWYMDYLELPVWAKWSSRVGQRFSAYAGVGGYLAWCLGGRYDFSTEVSGLDGAGRLTVGTADDVTVVRPMDYGVLFVVGGESRHMLFEVRFSVSVVPSMEFTPPPTFGDARGSLNSGIDLLLGYRI
jgi:hypothetical protein